jgi:hypothetical protein
LFNCGLALTRTQINNLRYESWTLDPVATAPGTDTNDLPWKAGQDFHPNLKAIKIAPYRTTHGAIFMDGSPSRFGRRR